MKGIFKLLAQDISSRFTTCPLRMGEKSARKYKGHSRGENYSNNKLLVQLFQFWFIQRDYYAAFHILRKIRKIPTRWNPQ